MKIKELRENLLSRDIVQKEKQNFFPNFIDFYCYFFFWSLVPFLIIFVCLIEFHFCLSVPFREAPSYSHRRRGLQSTLAAPRVLLRSNSDNNLNVNNVPEWSAASSSLHRSLSPQLLQQMQNNPNGTVKTIGSYSQVPRSRSPSLNRLGEDAKRQQHRHVRYALTM